MIGHVKISYGPNVQDCKPIKGGVLIKFSLRSFWVYIYREVLWKIKKISTHWTILGFGVMIGHVKINYGPKIRTVHLSQVDFFYNSVLDHSECIGKYCGKKIFLNTSTHQTILAFGAMIGHVKINYGPKSHDCTPLTSGVLLKFSFRSFWVHSGN